MRASSEQLAGPGLPWPPLTLNPILPRLPECCPLTSFEPRRVTWSTQGGWWWRWLWATWPGSGPAAAAPAGAARDLPPGPGKPQLWLRARDWTSASWQVDTKNQGRTALQMAAYLGQVELVRLLLQAQAGVDPPDDEGNTAPHYAALG